MKMPGMQRKNYQRVKFIIHIEFLSFNKSSFSTGMNLRKRRAAAGWKSAIYFLPSTSYMFP